MKIVTLFMFLLSLTAAAFAEERDTLYLTPDKIDVNSLRKGDYNYVIYFRKTKDSPSTRQSLIRMNVSETDYHGKPAIIVQQQWDRDTVYHTAYSVFSTKDFSTIFHKTWWKSLGYSMTFDFETKKVDYREESLKNNIPDSVLQKGTEEFNRSFDKYNLNWHDDLLIYTMLPYKANRVFVINYYDPGFGDSKEVTYGVIGSEVLFGSNGERINCWVLNRTDDSGYERFWISKSTREVLKEEDFGENGYRFKIKLAVSGKNDFPSLDH